MLATPKAKRRTRKRFFQSLHREQDSTDLEFGLVASRTLRE